MFGGLLGWYIIYTFLAALAPNGILPAAKFTLRPSLAFSYIGSVTARHSSSGRQPNFVALSRGRHPYSTGRPSRWASAHILVSNILALYERLVSLDKALYKSTVTLTGLPDTQCSDLVSIYSSSYVQMRSDAIISTV